MLAVDPMHNVFLGSGKHMLHLWKVRELLTEQHYSPIQDLISSFVVPPDVGRIPRKIETGFAGFTADQYKNWITVFSVPALYEILPNEHMECWRHFVLACRLLCQRKLSSSDITLIDLLLMRFCTKVEHLYGSEAVTPNMHMHGHLKEVLLDYGPVYGFWLFGFERYNGILGNQPNNNRVIEPQLMQRFIRDNSAFSFNFPNEFQDDFNTAIGMHKDLVGSVSDTLAAESDCMFQLPTKCKHGVFDSHQLSFLQTLYMKLHPEIEVQSRVVPNSTHFQYKSLVINGKVYRSSDKEKSPFIALAHWDEAMYGPSPNPVPNAIHPDSKHRPVKIHFFVKATFSNFAVAGSNHEPFTTDLLLAYVSWYFPHEDQLIIGKPAQVWCKNLFEVPGPHSFIPVDHIISRCAYCVRKIKEEMVLVIVPLVEQ